MNIKKILKSILVGFTFLSCLTACGNTEPVVGDANWIDYTHGGYVNLDLDYKGKHFMTDGIEQVSLKTVIDGDTAHFYLGANKTSGTYIKSRYYGIDTPESTGTIQEYGKEASNFNKQKLMNAAANGTIVVGSPSLVYAEPNLDSTQERYVSLIWINETKKNCEYYELSLLNLEIVQNGLSWAKNVLDMPEYSDTFYAAQEQAKKYKLNLFSGKKAALFNYGDYKDCSLLDLKFASENYIKFRDEYHSEWDGEKVRIRGTVAGYDGAGHTLYLQSHFSEEESKAIRGDENGIKDGEYASINIFTGMSGSIPDQYIQQNAYIEVCAVAAYSSNFGFQLSSVEGHFKEVGQDIKDDDVKLLLSADENQDLQKLHVFELTSAELDHITDTNPFECLNCAIKVTDELICSSAIGTYPEFTLNFKNVSFEAYVQSPYAPDPSNKFLTWNDKEKFKNQKFKIEGIFGYHQTANRIYYQIVITNNKTGLVHTGSVEA